MPNKLSRTQRHKLGLIFILASVLIAGHVLRLPRIVVDDAFISYRYAQNLTQGHGLTFNPGERVEGYSNFLWVLLTALGMRWNLEPVAWTRALGAAALMGSLLVAVHLARRLTGSNWAALAVALLLAASTALCSSAMAGLETGLYTLLITAVLSCAARKRLICASLLIGIGAITRPEGLAVWLVGIAVLVATHGRRRCWGDFLAFSLPCLLIAVGLVSFRYAYFGHFLPNSVQAKSVMLPMLRKTNLTDWPHLIFNDAGLKYVGDFIQYTFGAWFLFALAPIFRSFKNARDNRLSTRTSERLESTEIRQTQPRLYGESPEKTTERHWIACFMLGTVAMGLTVAVYNFGDWMSSFRLLTPYLPAATILVIWGMSETLAWLREQGRIAWIAPSRIVFSAAVLYCAAGQFQWRRPKVINNPDVELAATLNASVEKHKLLAATDVLGRLGYYAGQVKILDMAGLTNEHIARHGKPSPPFGRTDFDYVLSRRPDFIMNNVRSAWTRHLEKKDFVNNYWWVDRATWTQPKISLGQPRFVFVRRGSVLENELRARYPDASFRAPREIGSMEKTLTNNVHSSKRMSMHFRLETK